MVISQDIKKYIMTNIIKLKLFISGTTFRSQKAREYAGLLVADRDDIELDIIDVVQDPDAAEASKVLATPTLVKTSPPPERGVVGELKDLDNVKDFLEL